MSLADVVAALQTLRLQWRASVSAGNAVQQSTLQAQMIAIMREAVYERTHALDSIYLEIQASEASRAAGGGGEILALRAQRDALLSELEILRRLEMELATEISHPARILTRAEERHLREEEEETMKRFRFNPRTDQKMRALLLAAVVRPDVQERFLGTGGLRHEVIAQGVRPLPANMQEQFLASVPSEQNLMRMLARGGTMTTDNNFAAFRFCVAQNYTQCVAAFLRNPALDAFFAAKVESDGGEEYVWKLFLENMLTDMDVLDTGLEGVWLLLMDPRTASWVPTEQFVWTFVTFWQDFYDKTWTRANMFSALLTEFVRRRPSPLTTDFFVNILAIPKLFVEEMLVVAVQDPRFDTQDLVVQMIEDGEATVLQFLLVEPAVPRDARSIVTQEMLVHVNRNGDVVAEQVLNVVLRDPRTVITNAQGILDLFWDDGKLQTARAFYAYMKRTGRLGELVLTSQQEAMLNPQKFSSLVRKGKF